MSYKGYLARIEYDAEDEVFVGRLDGINDVVGFHADTVEHLKLAFGEAVDDYLAVCAKVGKPPEMPYSGEITDRLAPEVHAKIALAARRSGKNLDQWAEAILRDAAEHAIPA